MGGTSAWAGVAGGPQCSSVRDLEPERIGGGAHAGPGGLDGGERVDGLSVCFGQHGLVHSPEDGPMFSGIAFGILCI